MKPIYAQITGWGKCVPPAIVTNADLSTILDTSNQWIYSRTGMSERRISHVNISELAYVAASHALACASLTIDAIDIALLATCTADSMVPNSVSQALKRLGAKRTAGMDINTACTGFASALSIGSSYIKSGNLKRVLIMSGDCMSYIVPWQDRSIAVLFGDACGAIVLEATDEPVGLQSERLLSYPQQRDILRINYRCIAPNDPGSRFDDFHFQGPDIFKQAVNGMVEASVDALNNANLSVSDIDICVPHQANQRIIHAVAKRAGLAEGITYSNIHRYANSSAGTIPVALTEALEEGLVKPYSNLLIPAFGGGLSCSSQIVQWGERTTPLDFSDVGLPPCEQTGLEIIDTIKTNRGIKNS